MIPVEYSSNNSGGSDWLSAKDWEALRNAGWKLFTFDDTAYRDGESIPDKNGLPSYKSEVAEGEQDKDKFTITSLKGRYKYAYKLFNNIQEALKEFEELTGQDVTAEGCNCCGAPHSFTWGKDIIVRLPKERLHEQDYNYASGESLLEYIYPDKNTELSKRELLERQ
jgi:hypothetical protein